MQATALLTPLLATAAGERLQPQVGPQKQMILSCSFMRCSLVLACRTALHIMHAASWGMQPSLRPLAVLCSTCIQLPYLGRTTFAVQNPSARPAMQNLVQWRLCHPFATCVCLLQQLFRKLHNILHQMHQWTRHFNWACLVPELSPESCSSCAHCRQVWLGCCLAMAGTVLITLDHGSGGDAAASQNISHLGELPSLALTCHLIDL